MVMVRGGIHVDLSHVYGICMSFSLFILILVHNTLFLSDFFFFIPLLHVIFCHHLLFHCLHHIIFVCYVLCLRFKLLLLMHINLLINPSMPSCTKFY